MKWVLFDFDGTLVDSSEAFLHAWNTVAASYNFKPAMKEDIPLLFTYTMKQRANKYGFPLYKLPLILPTIYKAYRQNMHLVTVKPYVREVLASLKRDGYRLAVLSSNDATNIKMFLRAQQLDDFEEILTSSKVFGKDAVMKRFIQAKKLQTQHLLYIGDETRDIVACQKVSIPVVAVTWGFDARPLLEAEMPSYIIEDASTLYDVITNHFKML